VAIKIVWGRSIGWNIELNRLVKAPMSYNGAGNFNPSPGKEYMGYSIITDGAGCYTWTKTFVIWPRKSVKGKRLFWTTAYKRRVWLVWGIGFHMEPEVQYATLFDMLS